MASEFLTDITQKVLARTLDASAYRQKTIANNIANVETPGYKRRYVSFEDELNTLLKSGTRRDIRKGLNEMSFVSKADYDSPTRPDGNNVNIDAEMADLAKNSLKYRAITTLLEGKGSMLRSAIMGGR